MNFLSIIALLHVLAGVCSHPQGVLLLKNIYRVLLYSFVNCDGRMCIASMLLKNGCVVLMVKLC